MRTDNHLDSFPPFSPAQVTTQIVIESVNLAGATTQLKFTAVFVDQKIRLTTSAAMCSPSASGNGGGEPVSSLALIRGTAAE
jgi:hypothetical protein